MPFSVPTGQRAAEALYQTIIGAMQSDKAQLLELTCEKQTKKKVTIVGDQIRAVIVSEKDGSASAGRVPGFAGFSPDLESKLMENYDAIVVGAVVYQVPAMAYELQNQGQRVLFSEKS